MSGLTAHERAVPRESPGACARHLCEKACMPRAARRPHHHPRQRAHHSIEQGLRATASIAAPAAPARRHGQAPWPSWAAARRGWRPPGTCSRAAVTRVTVVRPRRRSPGGLLMANGIPKHEAAPTRSSPAAWPGSMEAEGVRSSVLGIAACRRRRCARRLRRRAPVPCGARQAPAPLDVPGGNADGVALALDYLAAAAEALRSGEPRTPRARRAPAARGGGGRRRHRHRLHRHGPAPGRRERRTAPVPPPPRPCGATSRRTPGPPGPRCGAPTTATPRRPPRQGEDCPAAGRPDALEASLRRRVPATCASCSCARWSGRTAGRCPWRERAHHPRRPGSRGLRASPAPRRTPSVPWASRSPARCAPAARVRGPRRRRPLRGGRPRGLLRLPATPGGASRSW